MKTVLIIACLFITINASCQVTQTVPEEQVLNNFDNVPDENAYIKDINHIFNVYIGTWKGNIDNIEYTSNMLNKTGVFPY